MIAKLSEMGECHALTNGENQDALCHGENKNLCVISLADGVSTCREAKRGASITCRAVTNLFLKKGNYFLKFKNEQIADFVLSHILCELKQQAASSSGSIVDFSSTVASVLVDKKRKKMLCFNLGDGIILASGNGRCKVLCMPADSSSGCCVTTTERAEKMVSVKSCDVGSLESVVICSDGAWRQMYDKNKLRPEVFNILVDNEFDKLKDFLVKQNCPDDFSFISLDMRQRNKRNRR